MPGEAPSRNGAAHALVALVAYVAGVLGAILLSVVIMKELDGTALAVWALPLALTAAVAMAVQLAGVPCGGTGGRRPSPGPGDAGVAGHAGSGRGRGRLACAGGRFGPGRSAAPRRCAAAAAGRRSGASGAYAPPPVRRVAGGAPTALNDLAGYAGLFQRVFLALLMLWTLLVALGIGSK